MQAGIATIWHKLCLNISVRIGRTNGFAGDGPLGSKIFGRPEECFNSTKRGYTMPAFTFEKISPPGEHHPVTPVANKKQRGVIIQILDRFAEARVKQSKEEPRPPAPNSGAD